MPLVAAKCTQCGSNLQVDSSKEATICPYCGTPFITEKAINNYKVEIGSVVVEAVSVETKLNNAETFFKLHGDVDKARELFEEVCDTAPADWRGWWGLVRIATEELGLYTLGEKKLQLVEKNVERAFNCVRGVDPDTLCSLETQWNDYMSKVNEWRGENQATIDTLRAERDKLQTQLNSKMTERTIVEDALYRAEKEGENCRKAFTYPPLWVYIVSGFLVFFYGLGLLILIPLVIRIFMLSEKQRKAYNTAESLRNSKSALVGDVYDLKKRIDELDKEIADIEHTLKNR